MAAKTCGECKYFDGCIDDGEDISKEDGACDEFKAPSSGKAFGGKIFHFENLIAKLRPVIEKEYPSGLIAPTKLVKEYWAVAKENPDCYGAPEDFMDKKKPVTAKSQKSASK